MQGQFGADYFDLPIGFAYWTKVQYPDRDFTATSRSHKRTKHGGAPPGSLCRRGR
jgi:hypothetical protein